MVVVWNSPGVSARPTMSGFLHMSGIFNDICRHLRIETHMRSYYPLLAERGGRELNKDIIKNYIILQKLYYTKNYTKKLYVI